MIKRLLSGCWFACNTQHARDDEGNLILKCQDCGSETRLLETPMYRNGPQHQPVEVKGRPTGKAIRESKLTRRFPQRSA